MGEHSAKGHNASGGVPHHESASLSVETLTSTVTDTVVETITPPASVISRSGGSATVKTYAPVESTRYATRTETKYVTKEIIDNSSGEPIATSYISASPTESHGIQSDENKVNGSNSRTKVSNRTASTVSAHQNPSVTVDRSPAERKPSAYHGQNSEHPQSTENRGKPAETRGPKSQKQLPAQSVGPNSEVPKASINESHHSDSVQHKPTGAHDHNSEEQKPTVTTGYNPVDHKPTESKGPHSHQNQSVETHDHKSSADVKPTVTVTATVKATVVHEITVTAMRTVTVKDQCVPTTVTVRDVSATPGPTGEKCIDGHYECADSGISTKFSVCSNGKTYQYNCAAGTVCRSFKDSIICDWA
ncbi:hypothetical protein K7432_014644 [Basidiobolus ranarum]|uniref:Chitin-binding type-2 domain-containing protein n=1 Tax=Basidiobolus ranarum TaxID=34480 RepID=A0ABR2VP61_9FUNG